MKLKKNTFVEIRATRVGEDYFNSIFCPKKGDIKKAVRKHLLDYFGEKEEEVEKDYLMDLCQGIVDGGGVTMRVTKPSTDIEDLINIDFKGF